MTATNFNQYPCLTPVRVVAISNQTGTYSNGTLNNGVGATFTYATGALTIDSVIVNLNDSVLLEGQTNKNENGIYICTQQGATGVSAVLTRRNDLQCIEQLLLGGYVSVSAGTVNAGAIYAFVEPKPAHFGVDDLVFSAAITSGLGTAATKAASDNAETGVASTTGSYTIGNLLQADDTAGTVEDSGFNVNNLLQYASVAITAAEFNGMYAAPKLIVAAPGANKLIVVSQVELIMTYGSAAFAAGGVVGFQYDSTAHGAGVGASNTEAAADFFQTASTTFPFVGVSGNTVAILPFTTTVNKGLYLSNLTQAFTTGTGSSFVCKVHYRIVATA